MKLSYLVTATAAVALLGGAASAQQPQPQKGPTPGSVTGDWNGAHSPPDDKQYQEKVTVPIGETPPAAETAPPSQASASTDVTAAAPSADTSASNGVAPEERASLNALTITSTSRGSLWTALFELTAR